MIRGTTAQFKFKLPYNKEDLTWTTVTFWQKGNLNPHLPIIKKLDDCESLEECSGLCVSLTAEETTRFSDKSKGILQLRAQHADGTVFACHQQLFTVYPMDDFIIEEDPTLPSRNEEGWIVLDGDPIINS